MALCRGDEEACHELRLIVGEAPDAAIGLDETDGEEIVELWMKDIEIETWAPVGVEDQLVVDERKRNLVARGIDEEVGLHLRPVGKADHAARELGDLWLDGDTAVGASWGSTVFMVGWVSMMRCSGSGRP